LLAMTSLRVAKQLWVQTELLELNHYVELREEFDRVHEQLCLYNFDQQDMEDEQDNGNEHDEKRPSKKRKHGQQYTTISFWPYLWTILHMYYRARCRSFTTSPQQRHSLHRYLRLHRKYRRLLVQVRFHELRVQFLQAYKLPLALKISNYLWRSQLHVLIGLVHVNMTAWLLLTLLANVLFVGIGLILYETEDPELIGTVLTCIFISCLVGFVLLAIMMHQKMEHIFDCIMTQKELWETTTDDESLPTSADAADTADSPICEAAEKDNGDHNIAPDETTRPKQQRAGQQLELFWFGDPSVGIALVQFMQFGYALALSIVIIFADVIGEGTVGVQWYLIVIAVSYIVFVLVVARIIPRYTLCTSLGELVEYRRLHETVAEFHLEEAKVRARRT
jgi:hypothetical protein